MSSYNWLYVRQNLVPSSWRPSVVNWRVSVLMAKMWALNDLIELKKTFVTIELVTVTKSVS